MCAAGASGPTVVTVGYYSLGGSSSATNTAQLPCPVGSYCVAGVQYLCPAGKWGNNVTGASTVCANNCSNGYLWYA